MKKNRTSVVLGAAWGDEGKGRITDYLSGNADIVVRYQGGNNAAHTVDTGSIRFMFSVLPAGILHPHTECVIASGVLVNPMFFAMEVDKLTRAGLSVLERVFISSRAHIILPYHVELSCAQDKFRGKNSRAVGTTRRGIGGAQGDKIAQDGISIGDLFESKTLATKLMSNFEQYRVQLGRLTGLKGKKLDNLVWGGFTYHDLLAVLHEFRDIIRDQVLFDSSGYLNNAVAKGKRIVFEGAQGALLDIEHGLYPYVTSTDTTIGGLAKGTGIPPGKINRVVGVVKPYMTRVSVGPLPTEIKGKPGRAIRERANEYIINRHTMEREAGRPLRIGWLDLPALRYSARINGFTHVCVAKVNALDTFPVIKVCKHYRYKGRVSDLDKLKGLDYRKVGKNILFDVLPPSPAILKKCEPVYEEIKGWSRATASVRRYRDLPPKVKKMVEMIAGEMGAKPFLVTVGPARQDILPWTRA